MNLPAQRSENGRTRIIEAAEVRRDVVFERLKQVDIGKFLYHVTNERYKKYYTLKKTPDKLKKLRKVTKECYKKYYALKKTLDKLKQLRKVTNECYN